MTIVGPIGCALLAALQVAGSDGLQEPVGLRWQLEPGEVLRYRVTRDQELEVDMPSLHRKGGLHLEETFRLLVQDTALDGKARAEVTLESLVGKLDRDDGLDASFDSTKRGEDGVEPFFEDHAAQLGRSRIVSISPDGTCNLVGPETGSGDVDSDERLDPTGWACSLPEGARLPVAALAPPDAWTSHQDFEALFAIEHGLLPWTVVATCVAGPAHSLKTQGLECASFELEASFALAQDEHEIADGLARGRMLEKAGKGRGSLVFARAEGVLVRFEVDGSTTAWFSLAERELATVSSPRVQMRNRMRVELLERRPPPR